MKKAIVVLILILVSNLIWSQNDGLHLGADIKTGVSWISSNEKNIENYNADIVFKYGFHGDYFFSERYSAVVGLYFSHMGGSHRYNFNNSQSYKLIGSDTPILENSDIVKYNLKYLEIPISIKMMTEKINNVYYYAKGGFDIRTRLSASADREGSINEKKINVKDEFTLFDMGWHVGLGVEYPIVGTTSLMFGLDYGQGFIDVTTDDGDSVEDVATNNYLSLNVSLIF